MRPFYSLEFICTGMTIKTKTYWNNPQKSQHVLCQWPDRQVQGQCAYYKTPSLHFFRREKWVWHISLWLSSSLEPLHLLNSNFFLTCLLVSVNSFPIASSKKLYLQRTDAKVLCQKMGVSTFHKERGGSLGHTSFYCAIYFNSNNCWGAELPWGCLS